MVWVRMFHRTADFASSPGRPEHLQEIIFCAHRHFTVATDGFQRASL